MTALAWFILLLPSVKAFVASLDTPATVTWTDVVSRRDGELLGSNTVPRKGIVSSVDVYRSSAAIPTVEEPRSVRRQEARDPADGAFRGGFPRPAIDVPLSALFLVLFATGAVTHMRIYRANAKRGHKFLISELIFDFCMVRNVTCILRIIWSFLSLRGIILAAQIFENGG
jgi:hypothetical protein